LTPKLQYSSRNWARKGACDPNPEKIFILQNISIYLNHGKLRRDCSKRKGQRFPVAPRTREWELMGRKYHIDFTSGYLRQ
jgi:hypothetical protein